MVLIGGVALYTLPVAQYPNVVPPTVSVTTSYPGASADTVMNTVALPIEQQVNGVQGMLYMQSTSASDGTYSLIVTFEIGTDLNFAQVLVQNRVSAAMASLPQAVQVQGVTVQQKSTSILQIVSLTSPDGALRQPVSEQLRHHQPGAGTVPRAGRRQCQRVRRRPVFHAHLAGPPDAARPRPDPAGRDQRDPAAEPAGHRRARSARRRHRRDRTSSTRSMSRDAWPTRPNSATSSSRSTARTAARSPA